jgi:hypothetical protein
MLRWDIRLPASNLWDAKYRSLVREAQNLLLRACDQGHELAPDNIKYFHRTILMVLEFIILENKGEVPSEGLGEFSAVAAAELVLAYRDGGASRAVKYPARLKTALSELVDREGRKNLWAWFKGLEPQTKKKLLNILRPVKSHEPTGVPAVRITEASSFVRWARIALARANLFDSYGFLPTAEVAALIETDPQRISRSARFLYELRQYELASDYTAQGQPTGSARVEPVEGKLSPGERYQFGVSTTELVSALLHLSKAASALSFLKSSPFGLVKEFQTEIHPLRWRQTKRTRLIPNYIAKKLIRRAIEWLLYVGPGVVGLLENIANEVARQDRNLILFGTNAIDQAFDSIEGPRIGPLQLTSFWRELPNQARSAEATGTLNQLAAIPVERRQLGLADLMDIHLAVCFSLVAIFACCRVNEVLDLRDDDLVFDKGYWYLRIIIRKQKNGAVRRTMLKPIPPVVAMAVQSLVNMRTSLEGMSGVKLDNRLFFVAVFNYNTISVANAASIYPRLDTMSEYFDLRTTKGGRWVISPHELRKFYAMSFFQEGDRENSLPALGWFMGHGDDITKTWHYVKEDLEGSEVSAVEAAWASMALRSQSNDSAVKALQSLLEETFGTQDLGVLSDELLQEYLVMLREEGKYTAEPKSIRTNAGKKFVVLVHVKGMPHG